MKHILASLALCIGVSNLSHGMDVPHSRLYDEAFAIENLSKNFSHIHWPGDGNDMTAYNTMRENYKDICNQNKELFKRRGYITLNGTTVTDLGIEKAAASSRRIKGSQIRRANDPENEGSKKKRMNLITIKEQDTYDAVHEISSNSNFKAQVAALNFANKDRIGGGYEYGSVAQEEDLCRCSTLYPCLAIPFGNATGHYKESISHDELIYTSGVKVIRSSYKKNYSLLDKPFTCNVITQAAYNHGAGEFGPDPFNDYDMGSMINKVRDHFRAAALNGDGSVVVGAFGCGAFKNDPAIVSQIYLKVLQESEFQNVFNEIRFAILGQTNLNIFKATLSALGDRLTVL